MTRSESVKEARKAMIAKRFAGNPNGATLGGGKKRKKMPSQYLGGDLAKITYSLKKVELIDLGSMKEVNIFLGDDTVVHIVEVAVKACIRSNTYLIEGAAEKEYVTSYLPEIQSQLSAEAMERLGIREEAPADRRGGGSGYGEMGMGGMPSSSGGAGAGVNTEEDSDDDSDVPSLTGGFEPGESDDED